MNREDAERLRNTARNRIRLCEEETVVDMEDTLHYWDGVEDACSHLLGEGEVDQFLVPVEDQNWSSFVKDEEEL